MFFFSFPFIPVTDFLNNPVPPWWLPGIKAKLAPPATIWHIRCALLALSLVSLIFNLNRMWLPSGTCLSSCSLPIPSLRKKNKKREKKETNFHFFWLFFTDEFTGGLRECVERFGRSLTQSDDRLKRKLVARTRLWRVWMSLHWFWLFCSRTHSISSHRPHGLNTVLTNASAVMTDDSTNMISNFRCLIKNTDCELIWQKPFKLVEGPTLQP